MQLKDVPKGSALVVNVTALATVNTNDDVLLGIRCWIDQDGNAVPYSEGLQLFRKELNDAIGENVVLLKQHKPKPEENEKL